MSKTIAIAGLGYLGAPLAQRLQTLGFTVKGSVTTVQKAAQFQQKGINTFSVEIAESGIVGEINALLKDAEYLVVLIPPGLRRNTGADHVLKMMHLVEALNASAVKKVILVSSTSVYDDSQGNVTEKDEPKPSTNSGKQLLQVEQLFFVSDTFETTIVRFGGLFGGSRNPAKYLAGRKDLNDGNAPVNLIQRKDCLAILCSIIQKEKFGFIFNAVNPVHPLKNEYYVKKALALNLVPPTFALGVETAVFKQVDSFHLETLLDFKFSDLT